MIISILHLQYHRLHFYEAYVSLKNHLVRPKVHENIKVKVTSKMPNHNCGYAWSNIATDRKIGSYLLD